MKPMIYFKLLCIAGAVTLTISACKKDEPDSVPTPNPPTNQNPIPLACESADTAPGAEGPGLVFKFRFNDQQQRLGSFGQPVSVPSGHAGQSPDFNSISAHYIELAPTGLTALGTGEVLYKGEETVLGGDTALAFDQAIIRGECEDFIRIPFSQFAAGTYQWIRVSLSYQNYDIEYKFAGNMYSGTLASFIGYNNYITSYQIKNEVIEVNDDKLQGFWGFETTVYETTQVTQDQSPITTVPNPLFNHAPIPEGSCVVTGPFNNPLNITGDETEDIVIVLSLSTNKSFEWIDVNDDGLYEPLNSDLTPTGEWPVDMGVRGLEAKVLD